MNYNACDLSAIPVSIFWAPLRAGNAAAAAGMVIVISSLWSFKLRAQKRVGPGRLLPSPGAPKSRPVQPAVFPSVALWLVAPPCSLEACSETHWLLGTRTKVCGWGCCLWYSSVVFEKSSSALGVFVFFAHLSPKGWQSRAGDCVYSGHLRAVFSSGLRDWSHLGIELFTEPA